MQARTNAIIQVLLFPRNAEVDKKAAQEIDWEKIAKEISAEVQIPEADIAILRGNDKFPTGHFRIYNGASWCYQQAIPTLAKMGHIKEALAYARKLSNESEQTTALNAIIKNGLTRKNQDEIAKIAQAIPCNELREEALREIGEFLIKTGQLEKTMGFIKNANSRLTHYLLKLLVHELLKIPGNNIEQFKRTLPEQQQMLVTQMIDNRNKLLNLANAGVMKVRIEQALASTVDQYDEILDDIAIKLVAKKKFDQAGVVCMNLLRQHPIIQTLILALIKEKNLALAEALTIAINYDDDLSSISHSFAYEKQYEAAERVALKIHDPQERDRALESICTLTLKGGNPLAVIRPASAIIEERKRTNVLYCAAIALLKDTDGSNEEVVDQILKAGAPPQELLNWGENCLTPNIIRRVVYENLVPDSVIRKRVQFLRMHYQDMLANMIDTEFIRTLAIREDAFKEYSTRLGAAVSAGLEEGLPITQLRNLIGNDYSTLNNHTELSEKQRQEFVALCLARDPRKT